jgi:hypothetical protein
MLKKIAIVVLTGCANATATSQPSSIYEFCTAKSEQVGAYMSIRQQGTSLSNALAHEKASVVPNFIP